MTPIMDNDRSLGTLIHEALQFFDNNFFKYVTVVKPFMQLNPADSVMDLRQFLLDAPETCFYTCYDLLLHAKDGSVHQMEDYNEISEVADITSGGCSLEMVAGKLMWYLF